MSWTVSKELITPQLAKDYLKKNNRNRKVAPKIVLHLAEQMTAEQWVEENTDAWLWNTQSSILVGT